MHTSKPQEWSALTNISSFMTHNELRKQLNIFGQLDAELDFTQYLIRSEIHKADEPRFRNKKRKKELKTDLVKALKSLTIEELIAHYNVMVQHIINFRQNILSVPPLPSSSFLITQAFARSYTLKLWKRKKLRFDRENHIIYAQKDKKIKIYDLSNYLVRTSSSSDFVCLVLEAINDVPLDTSKTVHFGFEYKNTFNLWMQNIQASVNYKQWERLGTLLHKRDQILQQQLTLQQEKQKNLAISKLSIQSSAEISSTLPHQVVQPKNNSRETIPIRQLSNHSSSKSDISQKQQFDNSFQMKISEVSQSQDPETNDQQEVLRQSYAFRLINQILALSIEQLQYELQKQTPTLKRAKQSAPIHNLLLKDYKLSKVCSFQGFQSILLEIPESVGKFTMHESKTDPTLLKFTYTSPLGVIQQGHNKQKLLKRLLDPQSVSKLNPKIEKLQIKCVIESQNCTINKEEHTPFNKLFRPRQFVYLRHLNKDEAGYYFIIDRSIQQEVFCPKEYLVRGNIFSVTRISEDHNQIMVLCDIRLQYKGNLLLQQEIKHSKQYLRHFAMGLSSYFSLPAEEPPKLNFYDYDLIFPLNQEQGFNQVLKSKRSELLQEKCPQRGSQATQKGFFRIPPAKVLIERNSYVESVYTRKIEENHSTSQYINRAFQPPRKPNNSYLNPKLGFLNREQDNFDWKTQVVPSWITEWAVNEQSGGLTYTGFYLKQKELKSMLQYTCRASINQKRGQKLSFPVDILAPQSHLERLMKSMAYAPSLFDHSLGLSTLQRLKKTIVFVILKSLLSVRVANCFHPVLGETYQCQVPSSCKGYAEQMQGNKAGVLMVGKQFQISSVVETRLKVLTNSAIGQSHGVYKIRFSDSQQIWFTMPGWQLTGLVYSTPTFHLQGQSLFWTNRSRLIVELDFQADHSFSTSPQAKTDSFRGVIYQVTPSFITNFLSTRQTPDDGNIQRVFSKIEGRWTKYIAFEDEKIILSSIPLFQMSNEHNSLPSDSSFREDINCLKVGKMQAAQAKKEALEDQERYDQRLRERAYNY